MKFKFLSAFAFLACAFIFSSQLEASHRHRHHHRKECRACKRNAKVSFGFGTQASPPVVATTTYVQQAPVVYQTYTPYGYTTYTQYQPAPVPVVQYIQPAAVQPVSVFHQPAPIYKVRSASSLNFGFSVRL